jgi:phosphatidate cytidylyltransferase
VIDDPKFVALGEGILALLTGCSLIGWALAKTAKSDAARATIANLNARIRAWWVMAIVLTAAIAGGRVLTLVLFALLSFLALREFISLTPTRRGDRLSLFLAFFVVIPLQYYLIGIGWYGLFAILIPVYAFLLFPALAALRGDTEDFLGRSARVQWGLMLAVYLVSHAPALLLLDIRAYAPVTLGSTPMTLQVPVPQYGFAPSLLLLYLIVVVQLSDVFQYVFGKLFGRHKLAPQVSPSKTVEGLVGGGLAAIGVGVLVGFLTPFTPLEAAAMSAAIVLAGFFGGLVLSAVKRDLGVKDWGQMIEGHGGILDRIDSVAFAAPIFFHITRYWFT